MSTRTSEDPESTLDAPAERSCLSPSEELLRVPAPRDALPAAALIGQRIGHFHVRSLIGRGGMGVVYRAEDEGLRREVALKVLPPSTTGDEERRRRLLREARAAAAVNHPNIATVYEVGEDNGRIYIAMELVQGQSLGQILAAGKLGTGDAISVARQILRGLQKAHDAGLVHRDLKPDNVMLTPDGVVKILDFGLAKQRGKSPPIDSIGEADPSVTAEGRVLGTPLYMSPEQARGVTIDHRSDLFSFGVVLYEMLTDRRPFAGETMADVLTAILRDKPDPPTKVNPEVPASLSRLVERCLAKDPGDRYPDGRSLMSDLDRLFPSSGEPSTPSASVRAAKSGSKAAPAVAVNAEPNRQTARWKTAAIAAGLVGIAATAIALRAMQPTPPPEVSAPAPPAPKATALTDLPLPTSKSPEAVAAYTEAVQAQRAGNWALAETALRRAIALDPLMMQAHLRLAMVPDPRKPMVENRTSYALAAQNRSLLSDRDQVLLRAIEPILDRDPPDTSLAALRTREATERYPFDAELFVLLAYFEQDHEAGLRAATRGAELDPLYADAWQAQGEQLAALGRIEESLKALDRCVQISPATIDCQGARAWQLGKLGRCTEMEEGFRKAISISPRVHAAWYYGWASALYDLGRPPETVLGVFERKWSQVSPEEKRRPVELFDRARLDIEAGRFGDAEARAREGAILSRSDPGAEIHARAALILVEIYTETGRLKDAAKVADEYLKRKDLWVAESTVRGTTMVMLRTMLHAGAMSKEAFSAARDAWIAAGPKVGDTNRALHWIYGYAVGIDQRDEAEEALAAYAQLPEGTFSREMKRLVSDKIGQVYALAGRADEALPYLRPEQPVCHALGEAPSPLPLGLVLEQKGDKDGACNAYAAVLDRWGNAKPRSVTAEKARTHAKALSCPERKLAAAPGLISTGVPPGLAN